MSQYVIQKHITTSNIVLLFRPAVVCIVTYMITTAHAIGNPIEYLQSEATPGQLVNDEGWQIYSGQDYDVLVRTQESDGFGVVVESVSPVLDRLYPRGIAKGAHILGQTVTLEWYLSPTAANALSQELGRTPGVDVLRFTHSAEDEITVYSPFLAKGQYLQSTGKEFFAHDRDATHAPGIWLMRPVGADYLKRAAATTFSAPIGLDMGTSHLTYMANNLVNADFDLSKIDTEMGYGYSPQLVGSKPRSTKLFSRSATKPGERAYTELAAHIQEDLLPAVKRALPRHPALQDIAVGVLDSLVVTSQV